MANFLIKTLKDVLYTNLKNKNKIIIGGQIYGTGSY